MARIRRSDPTGPGFTRRGRGRGFEYLDAAGRRIDDREVVERIRSLAIPPAWRDVWICPDALGHLQAVGVDAAGRRQYLYHERWRARRDAEKFRRMTRFARVLPELRTTIEDHLHLNGLRRDRVLACGVRLLDRAVFRIGTEEYASEDGGYGLATLERSHVRVRGDEIRFDYLAKGGARRIIALTDEDLAEVVRRLKRRRAGGDELLAHREDGRWVDVRSADLNAYIKEHAGQEFSAKDFRTWHGTVFAAVALAVDPPPGSRRGRDRAIASAMREVGAYLGNTPAVARNSYVDPRLLDRYRSGTTIPLDAVPEDLDDTAMREDVERAVLDLIDA